MRSSHWPCLLEILLKTFCKDNFKNMHCSFQAIELVGIPYWSWADQMNLQMLGMPALA